MNRSHATHWTAELDALLTAWCDTAWQYRHRHTDRHAAGIDGACPPCWVCDADPFIGAMQAAETPWPHWMRHSLHERLTAWRHDERDRFLSGVVGDTARLWRSGAGVADAWRTTSQRASVEIVEEHLASFDEFIIRTLPVRRGWADRVRAAGDLRARHRPAPSSTVIRLHAGLAALERREPATALAHLVRAADGARRDAALGAVCAFQLHRAHRMRGDLDAAIDALHRAKALAVEAARQPETSAPAARLAARCDLKLAAAYSRRGERSRAVQHGVSSVAGYEAAGFDPIADRVAQGVGMWAREAHDFDVAERMLWRARIAAVRRSADIAPIDLSLASVYRALKRPLDAIPFLQNVRALLAARYGAYAGAEVALDIHACLVEGGQVADAARLRPALTEWFSDADIENGSVWGR